MSVEPFSPDETTEVEPFDPPAPPAPPEPDRPATPGDTPDGLGSERPAAAFTSEIARPVQGIADNLGNTGFDQENKADPV